MSRVDLRSTLEPRVSHDPSEIPLTSRPLRPRLRYSTGGDSTPAGVGGRRRRTYTPAVLRLTASTVPAWTESALDRLDELLVDHAHCEKKAAGTALALLFRYPRRAFLFEPLSRLAREELVHFEEVLRVLRERGIPFGPLRPSPYAGRLRALVRSAEPGRLVDTLLCSALIEARSCERFRLLAEAVPDAGLRALYGGLRASEARHHRVYLRLAAELLPPAALRERLAVLADGEARVLGGLAPGARMHAGGVAAP
jgi:tRNA 2-(methylsulfanyl)-N6-isopentenyladenosine37 hydroxylase